MSGLEDFLYGLYDVVVFPGWIVLILCLIRMNKRFAASLFVWAGSLPVTVYCYVGLGKRVSAIDLTCVCI